MAFKSKKWVKPGTVLPDSNRTPLAPASVPVDNATNEIFKNMEPATRSAPPSRKWVKPGLAQVSALDPALSNTTFDQAPTPDITLSNVQHHSTPALRAEYPGNDPVPVNTEEAYNTSHTASLLPDPEASETPAAHDAARAVEAPAAEPPPPPPSYWKVIRAEAEAKVTVEESAAVPGAGATRPRAAIAPQPTPLQH